MKRNTWSLLIAASLLTFAPMAHAGTKSYQVTGPIVDVNDSMIVVQKGKEHWEIARDANTKVRGDLKVGTKVTVMYKMTASEIQTK